MPDPLILVVVAIAIIVIGLIASVSFSKNSRQRRAVILAFGALIVVVALLYIVVVVLRNSGLFPLFVILCLAVPIGFYFYLTFSADKKHIASTDEPRHDVGAAQDSFRRRQGVPAAGSGGSRVAPKPQPAAQPEPLADVTAGVKPTIHPEPLADAQPVAQAEIQPKPQPEVHPEPEPIAEPEAEPDALPDALQKEPQPEPQLSTDSKTEFDKCYAKAESFSKKNLFTVAGELFEKSAQLSDELALVHKAMFAAMNAYLKAGKKDDVKRLALTVKEDGTLTKAQEMRVAAILKMI